MTDLLSETFYDDESYDKEDFKIDFKQNYNYFYDFYYSIFEEKEMQIKDLEDKNIILVHRNLYENKFETLIIEYLEFFRLLETYERNGNSLSLCNKDDHIEDNSFICFCHICQENKCLNCLNNRLCQNHEDKFWFDFQRKSTLNTCEKVKEKIKKVSDFIQQGIEELYNKSYEKIDKSNFNYFYFDFVNRINNYLDKIIYR